MSQPEIPDNNLPVYLQQYKVYIFNKDYPECKTTCASSEAGCCADDVTPVPPGGLCPIGGCAGTEFGCCPFSTEAKKSPLDTCGVIAGKAIYNTVGAIPSNETGKRVWELNLSGELQPNHPVYYIVYDFQRVDYKYKDKITFENIVTGTLNICGRVLDASKYIEKSFCDGNETLTIKIDTRKWDFRIKKKVKFSYRLNVDDSSCSTPCTSGGYTPDKSGTITIPANTSKGILFQSPECGNFKIDVTTGSSLTVKSGQDSSCQTVSLSGTTTATIGAAEPVKFTATVSGSYSELGVPFYYTCSQDYNLSYPTSTTITITKSGGIYGSSGC